MNVSILFSEATAGRRKAGDLESKLRTQIDASVLSSDFYLEVQASDRVGHPTSNRTIMSHFLHANKVRTRRRVEVVDASIYFSFEGWEATRGAKSFSDELN